jgi:serine protease AprX
MKRMIISIPLLLLFVLWVPLTAQPGFIDPGLQAVLQELSPEDEISVIVRLSGQADIPPIRDVDKSLRRQKIITALKRKAELSHPPLKAFLEARQAKRIVSLWLINGLAVTARAGLIRQLADHPQIVSIQLDEPITAPPVLYGPATISEWNLNAIRAPELWSLGYTGQGSVVANMDTGVDVNHPDLTSKWRGGANSWYDPHGQHATPYDADGHGTQTMGLVVGGDVGGTAIGVAPDAKWIAVKIFNDAGSSSLSIIHQGFQWLLDPDGDPATDDAPNVVNNSWGLAFPVNECILEFQNDIEILKAAGIGMVFSAGNAGPNSSTSISPGNNPGGVAVGSVDSSLNIALSSSRGPSACTGAFYPKIVAPGVNVRTTDLTFGGVFPNSYAVVSGTSFAAPHLTGAMALLLSAFPHMSLSKLEWALTHSGVDLGDPSPDNTYGYGMLDVVRAHRFLRGSLWSDFDGDGRTDIGIYRAGTGGWYIDPSGEGDPYGMGWGGDSTDTPAPGDYDGDGRTDIAVYRGNTGAWYINPSGGGDPYGMGWGGDATDKPVPGDYDGDGRTDIAVYRGSTGAWYINPSGGGDPYGIGWGGDPTDRPVPGDYDGDGRTDIAVYRSSTGGWYIIPSSTGAPYGIGWGGDPTDQPVPGDYDGDGRTDIAVYRSSTGGWYIMPSSTDAPYGIGWGGDTTDKPVPGDYDADGKTDIAVYRSSTGGWYIMPSSTEIPYGLAWGGDPTDVPVHVPFSY